MSLVVEASSSSPAITKSTTSDQQGFPSSFTSPLSPESPPPPIIAYDFGSNKQASPTARVWTKKSTTNRGGTNFGDHRDFSRTTSTTISSISPPCPPRTPTDNNNDRTSTTPPEFITPIKKNNINRRLLDLDPFTVFDSSSRDSGFESEASRLSVGGGGGANSDPGTPSSNHSLGSSSSGHGSSSCLTPPIGRHLNRDDPLSVSTESLLKSSSSSSASTRVSIGTHLCFWDDCTDPDLLLEYEEDESRKDLLSHVLSRHVQPLEFATTIQKTSDRRQLEEDDEDEEDDDDDDDEEADQPRLFKCFWKACKVYGKGSKLYSWLENHVIERHAGKRPFACPLPGCRQRFGSKLSAERHINSHFVGDDIDSHSSSSLVKDSCEMAPSNLVNNKPPQPPRISSTASSTATTAFPRGRRDLVKSPSNCKHQLRIVANTRASAKRRLLREEDEEEEDEDNDGDCRRQLNKRPQEKSFDRATTSSAAKLRRENVQQQQQGRRRNGSKATERIVIDPDSNGVRRTRHAGKSRIDINQQQNAGSNGTETTRTAVNGLRGLRKQLSTNSSSSTQSRCSSILFNGKNSSSTVSISSLSSDLGCSKAGGGRVAEAAPGTTAVNGGTTTTIKRKSVRIRHLAEDAFDPMHMRVMHVLAARYMLKKKNQQSNDMERRADNNGSRRTNGGKRSTASACHKCSGNILNTDISSSSSASSSSNSSNSSIAARQCVCSNYVTFHAKILAKRSCVSKSSKFELFCSWTPAGLLSPKWIEESAFHSVVHLPRSLFPSLARPKSEEAEDQEEDEDDVDEEDLEEENAN